MYSVLLLPRTVSLDQRIGRGIVLQFRLRCAFEFWHDSLRENLAQFHAPLIERADIPDHALREDDVLVQGNERTERKRRKLFEQEYVRRTIARERLVRYEPVRNLIRLHLLSGLPERQSFCLREDVGHQQVVMPADWVERFAERDEIARDQFRPLVDQLIKAVLTIRARFAPVHRTRLVIDFHTAERDSLPVALHRQLLQVRGESLEVLIVGQYRDRLRAEEAVVPDTQQTHEHRQVLLEWRGAEVFVHCPEASEHVAKLRRADCEHRGQ